MADVKISELNALASTAIDVSADVFAVVDTSATQTKKISVENVLAPIVINKASAIITNLGTVTTADINGGTWQGTIDGNWTAASQTCANLGTVSAATSITSTAFVGALTGNADTVTNGVYTTGTQTISGAKTFSADLVCGGPTTHGGKLSVKQTGDERAVDIIQNGNSHAIVIEQNAAQMGINIDQNGNSAAIYIDTEATSAQAIFIDRPTIATENIIEVATPDTTTHNVVSLHSLDSLTSGRALFIESDSNSTTSRSLVEIINNNVAATGTTCLKIVQDSVGVDAPCIELHQTGQTTDSQWINFHDIDALAWQFRKSGDTDDSDADANLQICNGATTQVLLLEQNTNATFAGTITANGGPVMSKPVWSGWQGSHNQTADAWQSPTLNTHILTMDTDYADIDGSEITIVQAGYYRVEFTVLQHTASESVRLQRIEVDGSNVHYGYHANQVGWNSEFSHYSGYMAADTTIEFFLHVTGTDPYAWHSLDASRHSYATLIYLGK